MQMIIWSRDSFFGIVYEPACQNKIGRPVQVV